MTSSSILCSFLKPSDGRGCLDLDTFCSSAGAFGGLTVVVGLVPVLLPTYWFSVEALAAGSNEGLIANLRSRIGKDTVGQITLATLRC